jgi:hypothetical protein
VLLLHPTASHWGRQCERRNSLEHEAAQLIGDNGRRLEMLLQQWRNLAGRGLRMQNACSAKCNDDGQDRAVHK